MNPGGCSVYVLPVNEEQKFAIIHPARKAGDPWENYCPKGRVDVQVTNNDQQTTFSCFPDPDDCRSNACVGSFESIITEGLSEIELSLCVNAKEVNTASIWEINISKVDIDLNISRQYNYFNFEGK